MTEEQIEEYKEEEDKYFRLFRSQARGDDGEGPALRRGLYLDVVVGIRIVRYEKMKETSFPSRNKILNS